MRDKKFYLITFTIMLYFTFIVLRIRYFNYDPSYFLLVGEYLIYNSEEVPKNISVLKNSGGYDGQYYYRLALNPFTRKKYEFGITLDEVSYRSQRILYPLLVWLFSFFGNYQLVPYMMIFVNFLCLSLFIYFINLYLQDNNSNLLKLAVVLYPGFILTLSRSLPEIVALAFISIGLYLLKKGNFFLASVFMSLSVLAKETTLMVSVVIVSSYVILYFLKKKSIIKNYMFFIIPLIVYLIWVYLLYIRWKEITFIEGKDNFGLPLNGIVNYIFSILPPKSDLEILWLIEISFVLMFVISVLVSLYFSSAELYIKIAFVVYFLMMLCYSNAIWVEDWAFLRATTEMVMFGWLVLLYSSKKFNFIKIPIFIFEISIWVTLFLIHIKGI